MPYDLFLLLYTSWVLIYFGDCTQALFCFSVLFTAAQLTMKWTELSNQTGTQLLVELNQVNRTEDWRGNKTGVFLLIVTVKQLPGSMIVMCEACFVCSLILFFAVKKEGMFPSRTGSLAPLVNSLRMSAAAAASLYHLGNTFTHSRTVQDTLKTKSAVY